MRVILLFAVIGISCAVGSWKVSDVDRTVDVSSQIVKSSSLVTFENTDSGDQKDVLFVLSDEDDKALAYVAAHVDGTKGKLKITKLEATKTGYQTYKIDLTKAVKKGELVKLRIDHRLTGVLSPFPAKIRQQDSQFVQYIGSAYYLSAYPVSKEKSTFKLASGKTQSATTVNPSKQETEKVVYGPYTNQPAYNTKDIKIHYENNSPMVVAAVVDRIIEISHWGGNIAVEEYIELVHKGAQLEGSFSRLDYQMDRRGRRQPALQDFTTILPATARDIYYRDEIGNISTSAVRLRADSVELHIKPRFPLFGSWRTSYVIGYNVPSFEYLYKNGNNEYALKMRVLDHIFDNIVVEKLSTKIILPELAKKVKLSTPYNMDRRPDEFKSTYLDTTGRTIVVLQKNNLVPEHIQKFTLSYEFDSVNLLREPMMTTAFFFVLFTAFIIYVRLDFTIVSDPQEEVKNRIHGKVTLLSSLVDKKQKLFANIISEVSLFKSSRDEASLLKAKKDLESERTLLNDKLNNAVNALQGDSLDSFNKAQELRTYDKSVVDAVDAYIAAVQKSQQKSGSEDTIFQQKVDDARTRADSILAAL